LEILVDRILKPFVPTASRVADPVVMYLGRNHHAGRGDGLFPSLWNRVIDEVGGMHRVEHRLLSHEFVDLVDLPQSNRCVDHSVSRDETVRNRALIGNQRRYWLGREAEDLVHLAQARPGPLQRNRRCVKRGEVERAYFCEEPLIQTGQERRSGADLASDGQEPVTPEGQPGEREGRHRD
jgi:hypothetical protein